MWVKLKPVADPDTILQEGDALSEVYGYTPNSAGFTVAGIGAYKSGDGGGRVGGYCGTVVDAALAGSTLSFARKTVGWDLIVWRHDGTPDCEGALRPGGKGYVMRGEAIPWSPALQAAKQAVEGYGAPPRAAVSKLAPRRKLTGNPHFAAVLPLP